jgi:integrase/recombinase XerD
MIPPNPPDLATVANAASSGMEEYMARFKVTVRENKSTTRPHLRWVVDCKHPTKGRQRSYFRTKETADADANARRVEIENYGVSAMQLSAAERIEAFDSIQRLKEFGATLTQAASEFIEKRRGSTKTVAEVGSLFLESRVQKNRSVRHLDGVRIILARFDAVHGERRIKDVTAEQIIDWLVDQKVGPTTTNHMRAILHSVFGFALKRKILRENPVGEIEKEKIRKDKVGILTPEQMKALLVAAGTDYDVLATLAIGGFAGVRPEEIKRLSWSAIDLERGVIDCGSEVTKTASHRYVKIEPVLTAWLQTIPLLSLRQSQGGTIRGDNFRRRFDEVRIAAGFSVRGSKGIPWPHDALRHSFGSYHLAHFKNAANTALEMGHQGTAMLFANYRSRVGEMDAREWWVVFPERGA